MRACVTNAWHALYELGCIVKTSRSMFLNF
jgi:hypothetical protein